MCKIIEVIKFPVGDVISCTSTDADFTLATSVDIVCDEDRFRIKKFSIEKKRQCFQPNPIAPGIRLKEAVPEKFLQRGNEVIFNVQGKAYA